MVTINFNFKFFVHLSKTTYCLGLIGLGCRFNDKDPLPSHIINTIISNNINSLKNLRVYPENIDMNLMEKLDLNCFICPFRNYCFVEGKFS